MRATPSVDVVLLDYNLLCLCFYVLSCDACIRLPCKLGGVRVNSRLLGLGYWGWRIAVVNAL